MAGEELELERWRAALMSELGSPDIGVSTRALLAMTLDDPERERVEAILLECLSPDTDPQIRALAVTCMGHVGRIHKAVSAEVVRRLEGLVDDRALGGLAEDALGDIAAFAGEGLK